MSKLSQQSLAGPGNDAVDAAYSDEPLGRWTLSGAAAVSVSC